MRISDWSSDVCSSDLYLHRVDPQVPIEDSIGTMAELVSAGKVGGIGICEASPGRLRRAHKVHPLSACQMEYSLWYREAEDEVLPLCRELGIAFVAYCPLGRGFLTGTVDRAPSSGDIRAKDPRFDAANMASNRRLLAPLARIARRLGCHPGQRSEELTSELQSLMRISYAVL